jgi:hypothetical protein
MEILAGIWAAVVFLSAIFAILLFGFIFRLLSRKPEEYPHEIGDGQ